MLFLIVLKGMVSMKFLEWSDDLMRDGESLSTTHNRCKNHVWIPCLCTYKHIISDSSERHGKYEVLRMVR